MDNAIKLSIIIPVYNEKDNILNTIKSLKDNISVNSEILIVYDSDEDTTIPIIKNNFKESDNLILLKNNIFKGPSGAIRAGIKYSSAELILVTMADLCDDHTQISEMIYLMKDNVGVISPSRYCKDGEHQLENSFKKFLPLIAGKLLKLFTKVSTSDPTNSYKLYSRTLLSSINLSSTTSFSVTLEIVVKASCLNFSIVEIPTVWRKRQSGVSNFKIWRSIVTYLPWFLIAMLNTKFISLPESQFKKWFYVPHIERT